MCAKRAADHFKQYREWQWIKHLVLQDYLWPWAHKLGSIANAIYVVDAFAGAGSYQDSDNTWVPGSPLISADVAIRYQAQHPDRRMQVICVERDQANYDVLSALMQGYEPVATTIHSDFFHCQDRILDAIGDAPTLLLLDPFGIKDITADRCLPFLRRAAKTDVFVIVIMSGIHRTTGQLLPDGSANPRIPGAQRNVDNTTAFFGTDRWKAIALRGDWHSERKESEYLGLYFAYILGDRYPYKSAYEVRKRLGGPIKYWLVSASAHPDAMWLVNDGIVKVDEIMIGQHYQRPGFLPGLGTGVVEAYREAVANELTDAILDQIRHDNPSNLDRVTGALLPRFFGRVKQGAYARCIKALVRDGRVAREERPAAALRPRERLRPL